jgi:hypothetical protein
MMGQFSIPCDPGSCKPDNQMIANSMLYYFSGPTKNESELRKILSHFRMAGQPVHFCFFSDL